MSKKVTTQEWIQRAMLVHGDKYDYSLVEYKNAHAKVKIICDKGHLFEQAPYSHLSGIRCTYCRYSNVSDSLTLKQEQVISKFIEKHGYKYCYSLVDYVNARTKVKIVCPTHDVFEQTPSAHKRGAGCPKCSNNVKLSLDEFIQKAISKHGNVYDYSLVKYNGNNVKIDIICKIHNIFSQTPCAHLNGQGCPKCGYESVSLKNGLTSPGWNVKNWVKSANTSKYFDYFKVYIIRCWNDNEQFYKIGRTFTSTEMRFRSSILPYKYEVLRELIFDKHSNMVDNAKECFIKENELKRLHKEFKYIPSIKFGGMRECFSKINI